MRKSAVRRGEEAPPGGIAIGKKHRIARAPSKLGPYGKIHVGRDLGRRLIGQSEASVIGYEKGGHEQARALRKGFM